jgi:phenylpropionate dioxygenase-like ring-hydroxylating dioxygenase large terminal subunit
MSELSDITRFFHPVLAAARLRNGPVRVEVAGRKYALWRDASGAAAAVVDACPHRLAPLSRGNVRADGRLACAYHGWNFDSSGNGRSPSQPTLRCDTVSCRIIEKHGYLWLASRQTPVSALPSIGWDGFDLAGSFEALFPAPLHVALDNFSEDEHFPYVHFFLGWNEGGLAEVEFEAKNFDDRTEVLYRGPQRPSPWLPLLGVKKGDRFQNEWVTRFDPVHAVFTFHWFDARTGAERPLVARTAVFMVPETSTTTRFHTFIFVRIGPSLYRLIKPIVRRATMFIGRRDVACDARWIANVADTPLELRGMRLGKFDKPLIRNRKLLSSIYWGHTSSDREDDDVQSGRRRAAG